MTTTSTQLRRGFRAIPEFSNYAINRSGQIYNTATNRNITPRMGAKYHWSGSVGITNDYGTREWYNVAELVAEVFNIQNENTLRRAITGRI